MTSIGVDPAQGIRFLRFLDAATVEAKKPFLFGWLNAKRHGMTHELLTAEQWAKVLPFRAKAGWNSFITVQAMTDGKRTNENVAYTRAYFLDFDKTEPKLSKDLCPPDAIVQSKNGQHWYWRCNDPVHLWSVTECALVTAFGADQRAKDLARVLRMPGSLHLKDVNDPFLVTLEHCVPRAPTLRTPELRRAYNLDMEAAKNLVLSEREVAAPGDIQAPEHLSAFLRAVQLDPTGQRNLRRRPGKAEWVFDCPMKDHSHAKVVVLLKDSGDWTLFCQSGKPDCTRDNIFDHFGVGWGIRYAKPYSRKNTNSGDTDV